MTPQERNDYKWKWHRFQQRYEAIYTTQFKKALREQVRQWQRNKWITSDPIYEVLLDLYRKVGPLWAARTGIHRIKTLETKERLPMGFSDRIVELMRQYYNIDLINDAELMTAKSREVIAAILGDAATSGASLDETVQLMLEHHDFSEMRARRIARTEVVTSANGAAWINAKESGLKMKKEWISIDDKRTRHSHRDIDGTILPLDEPFNVNGTLMMQPGIRLQPNGDPVPAKEVVNCRCTEGFVPQLDRRGRPVLVANQ